MLDEVQKIITQLTDLKRDMGNIAAEEVNKNDLADGKENLSTDTNEQGQQSQRTAKTENKKTKNSQRMTQSKTQITNNIHLTKLRIIHAQPRQITKMRRKRS